MTLSGIPTGVTPSIAITGPGDYANTISATSTLGGLATGSYTISAPALRQPGTIVDTMYNATVTGSPATVPAGGTATAAVSYTKRVGTGMMYVTNYTTRSIFAFNSTTIAKKGISDDAPAVQLTLSGVGTNNPPSPAIAFSSSGDLWTSTCRDNQTPQVLAKFSSTKLGATSSPTPDVTITLPAPLNDTSYDCADALAFDASGNLWVGINHGHILKYAAADLATSGSPAPAVNLTNGTYFSGVLDIAFDSAGNLYVASYNTPVISRLSAAQLAATDLAVVPAVQLTLPAGTGPGGLAFGSDGGLWVADYNTNSVIKLKSTDLATTATPSPALTITGVPGPEQMAFDRSGNLWIAAYNASSIVALAAADLTTGGAKTAMTTLTGNATLSTSFAVRFNPGAP